MKAKRTRGRILGSSGSEDGILDVIQAFYAGERKALQFDPYAPAADGKCWHVSGTLQLILGVRVRLEETRGRARYVFETDPHAMCNTLLK